MLAAINDKITPERKVKVPYQLQTPSKPAQQNEMQPLPTPPPSQPLAEIPLNINRRLLASDSRKSLDQKEDTRIKDFLKIDENLNGLIIGKGGG